MRVLRALSLDVVAGAACGGLMAETMTGSVMAPSWWVALLAAVWSIYTGDHLLDARRSRTEPLSYRHAFHRRHSRALGAALACAIVIGLLAAATLRPPVRLFGIGLTLAVVAYLASAQGVILAGLPKEPMAGALYAAGIWGGPIVMGAGSPRWLMLAAGLHGLAAVLNLTMLGIFEAEADRKQEHRSLALRFGSGTTTTAVLIASGIGASASAALAIMQNRAPILLVAFVALAIQIATPALLLLARGWAQREERYRRWGDSVFLLGATPRLLG